MSEEPDWELIEQKITDFNDANERKGSCNRCGKCCYVYEEDATERTKCEHLEFDGEGLAMCKLYGTEDYPKVCEAFPAWFDDDPYWEECGFYWMSK